MGWNRTMVLGVCVFATATALSAQDALPSFKDPSEMVEGWYHRHEKESWVARGADPEVVDQILERVENAPGERRDERYVDSLAEYGPGHWVYEWADAGEDAMRRAADASKRNDPRAQRQALDAAVLYFTVASWPHLGRESDRAALARARDAYLERGRLVSPPVQHVEFAVGEKTSRGYLHLPEGSGPFPLVIYTNGSDVTKESNFGFFERELRHRGLALFTVDLPGIGESREIPLIEGSEAVLDGATTAMAARPEIDADAIFLAGASFGGHAAARAFFTVEAAGVVSMCGPLHRPFLAPPEVYDELPALTIDGVKSRLGILGESSARLAEVTPALALGTTGIWNVDEPLETPLLIITTNRDPVAPLEDLEPLQQAAANVETLVLDQVGHCPDHWVREPVVAHWVQSLLD